MPENTVIFLSNMAKPKILLIEDDLPTIQLYQDIFKAKAKLNIDFLTTGSQAIEYIKKIKEEKEKKPDLILLDLILPDISGLEVLESIKDDPKTKDIKVIVLTNLAISHYEPVTGYPLEKVVKEKADKVLIKIDVSPQELVKISMEMINEKNKTSQ